MMGSVFAMQGFGQFGAAIIALIVTAGFKDSLSTASSAATCSGVCSLAVDKMWRVIIGFGAVPGCIALYYRLTIPETPRYTFDVARDIVKAGSDIKAYKAGEHQGHPDEITRVQAMNEQSPQLEVPQASWRDFVAHYSQWKYGKVLLGTAGSWFFLDVAFYGLGLNNSIILTQIGYGTTGTKNMYEYFFNSAVGNLILICAGAIPGYWVTVATVDTVGRKPIQLMGFTILTILFCIIGFAYHQVGHKGLLALYVLSQFFFNFGKPSFPFPLPNPTPPPPSSLSPSLSPSLPTKLTLPPPRPQRHDLHRAGRVLPDALPLLVPRRVRRRGQGRRHHRAGAHRPAAHARRHARQRQPLAQPRHADLRPLHVPRHRHLAAHPRDQAQDARAARRRGPRHPRVRPLPRSCHAGG